MSPSPLSPSPICATQIYAEVAQASCVLEYRCLRDLDLYATPDCQSLTTQLGRDRHLRITHLPAGMQTPQTIPTLRVCGVEDDYPGWLKVRDLEHVALASAPYQAQTQTRSQIETHIEAVIGFTQAAMAETNHYLWGGAVAPHYDCSGLMQAAFRSVGIWLPRDAYLQEAFCQAISPEDVAPGDLVFFGSTPEKATHVALYLGGDSYIHSSGASQGRNGIGIDQVSGEGHPVSQTYRAQLRSFGRVMQSYLPNGTTHLIPPDRFPL